MKYEIDPLPGSHEINSDNIMICAETGRVIAVFHNDYDLEDVIQKCEEYNELLNKHKELIMEWSNKMPIERDLSLPFGGASSHTDMPLTPGKIELAIDPIDERIEEFSTIIAAWQKNRDRGRPSLILRRAVIMAAGELHNLAQMLEGEEK